MNLKIFSICILSLLSIFKSVNAQVFIYKLEFNIGYPISIPSSYDFKQGYYDKPIKGKVSIGAGLELNNVDATNNLNVRFLLQGQYASIGTDQQSVEGDLTSSQTTIMNSTITSVSIGAKFINPGVLSPFITPIIGVVHVSTIEEWRVFGNVTGSNNLFMVGLSSGIELKISDQISFSPVFNIVKFLGTHAIKTQEGNYSRYFSNYALSTISISTLITI